jgi:hypothetical protein
VRRIALFLLGAMLLPSASAQLVDPPEVVFRDASLPDRLPVEGGGWKAQLLLSVGCNQADLLGQQTEQPNYVNFTVAQSPAYAQVFLSSSRLTRVFDPATCAQEPDHAEEFQLDVTITLSRQAPAFESGRVRIDATVEKPKVPEQNTSYGPYSANATFVVDYFANADYTAENQMADLRPGQNHTFMVRARNLGNGPSRIAATLGAVTSVRPGVTLPPMFALGSAATGGGDTEATMLVGVVAPHGGRVDQVFQFEVVFTAVADHPQREPANNHTSAITFQVRMLAGPRTPAPEALFVIIGLAIVAAGGRRR